jgi:AcrR family transcriptional regulator
MEKKKKKVPTRQLLLETAGELFAENGMKGTSIKMIADRSKQNIAAANYHFGSKKNLFIETLKFVVDKLTANSNTKPGKISAKNFNSELENFVKSRCKLLFSKSTPTWYGGLIVRAFHEAPKPVQELALEFFSPEVVYLESLAKAAKPKIKPFAAKMWAYSVISQIIFYVFARRMILIANNRKSYSPDFIKEVTEHIIKVCKAGLKA